MLAPYLAYSSTTDAENLVDHWKCLTKHKIFVQKYHKLDVLFFINTNATIKNILHFQYLHSTN